MHKSKREAKVVGLQAFTAHYQKMTRSKHELGALLESLVQKNTPCILVNPDHLNELAQIWHENGLSVEPLDWFSNAFTWPKELPFPTPLPGHDKHWFYLLNPASLLPVVALDAQPEEVVLDACAAPGGKTLAISWSCAAKNSTLVANELSQKRYIQLKKDMQMYGLEQIEIAHMPAEIIAVKAPNAFDKILLDAPCSSEKHVMQNPKVLNLWTPKRISKLVERQYRLIISLIKALKVGGILLYATCAVNTQENEGVVSRVLKSMRGAIELIDLSFLPAIGAPGIEGTYSSGFEPGKVRRVMPHKHIGFDPMFIAGFKRVS